MTSRLPPERSTANGHGGPGLVMTGVTKCNSVLSYEGLEAN